MNLENFYKTPTIPLDQNYDVSDIEAKTAEQIARDPAILSECLSRSADKSNRLRAPHLFTLLFKSTPLRRSDLDQLDIPTELKWRIHEGKDFNKSPKQSKTLSKSQYTFYLPWNEHNEVMTLRDENGHGTNWYYLPYLYENFLVHTCEFKIPSLSMADVGQSMVLSIDKADYIVQAHEILELMTDIKKAKLLFGYENDDEGYKKEMNNPESEVRQVIQNLCRLGELNYRELSRLISDATQHEHYEFALALQAYNKQNKEK
jgi:hypothetical protein